MKYHFEIEPIAKPRATQRDRWNPSKATQRYRRYADELRRLWEQQEAELPDSYHLIFVREMPKSWSKKKRDRTRHTPCRCRPDKDNLEKGFLDALFKNRKDDDAIVWDGRVSKIWGDRHAIILLTLEPFDFKRELIQYIS